MRVDVSVERLRVCSLQSSDVVARVDPQGTPEYFSGVLGRTQEPHASKLPLLGVTESLLTGYIQGKI